MAKTPGQLVSSGRGGRTSAAIRDARTGHHKALAVDRDAIIKPGGVRVRADEEEHVVEWAAMRLAAVAVAEQRRGEPLSRLALETNDFGPLVQGDIGQRGDTLDEIARHGGF